MKWSIKSLLFAICLTTANHITPMGARESPLYWLRLAQGSFVPHCGQETYVRRKAIVQELTKKLNNALLLFQSWERLGAHMDAAATQDIQVTAEILLQMDCFAFEKVLQKRFGRNAESTIVSFWNNRFHEDLWERSTIDISCLGTLDLEGLGLQHIPSILKKTPSISHIRLDNNKIDSLEGFPQLQNLRCLGLNGNNIREIQNLPRLPTLHLLGLNGNHIRIPYLQSQPLLEKLFLDNNDIATLEGFAEQPHLKILSLKKNKLCTLDHFPHTPELKTLGLTCNSLKDLHGLPKLVNPQTLAVEKNDLESFASLQEQPSLIYLMAQANRINTLSHMPKLESLELLVLEANQISDLNAVVYLPRLKTLELDQNALTTLDPTHIPLLTRITLMKVQTIMIRNNKYPIQKIEEFRKRIWTRLFTKGPLVHTKTA